MQMIDVLKRLAELDAQNPRVKSDVPVLPKRKVAESQVDECGMMGAMTPEMHMPSHPPTPATINMTAGSADELGNLLKDIVSLAGMKTEPAMDMPTPMADMPPPAEPEMGPDSPSSPADTMRSVIDKLNPMDGDDQNGEEPEGPEQDGQDGVTKSHGDVDDDGDHDMDDHDAEKEKAEEEWDNAPSDPNKPPPFDANKMSNQDPAGHPGAGDRMDGDRPKAFATFEDQLMWEYKKFIQE
jgi:hypothetical protein